jgi:hypothetical protein
MFHQRSISFSQGTTTRFKHFLIEPDLSQVRELFMFLISLSQETLLYLSVSIFVSLAVYFRLLN